MAITPREEQQQIRELHFIENLKFLPQYVENFFVSNIVQRALSHLVGWTGTHSRMLICTSGGILKVAPTGAGFEHLTDHKVTGSDSYKYINWDTNPVSRIDIWVKNADAVIGIKNNVGVYEGEIELEAGSFYSMDVTAFGFRYKNKNAGQNTFLQIVGWY